MPNRMLAITSDKDIPAVYRGTAIELLFQYQNLGVPHAKYQQAQLLVGMCIDYRKQLNIPENFAYMIRTAGANMRLNEFKVSFAVAVGGVSTIALIAHTQCGMVGVISRKDAFVEGLVERAGWDREEAEAHFLKEAPLHEIVNETDFVMNEAKRLKLIYPKILIAPLIYKVEDGLLYLVRERE